MWTWISNNFNFLLFFVLDFEEFFVKSVQVVYELSHIPLKKWRGLKMSKIDFDVRILLKKAWSEENTSTLRVVDEARV